MELVTLTDETFPEARRVFVESLGGRPRPQDDATRRGYWTDDRTFLAVEDDRVLGVAAGFASRFTLAGGDAVPCATVPSVGVRADAQGRGVGRMLLEHQVHDAAERGDAVMALNASEVAIYGRFGYGPTSSWWSVAADPRHLEWRDDAPAPVDVEVRDVEDARDDLVDLHARAFGRWPGELDRTDGWWTAALSPRPDDAGPLRVVLHRDEQGRLDAAAIHTVKQGFDDVGFANELAVLNHVALDARADLRLWRWLLSQRLLGKVTCDRVDPGTALPWALRDSRKLRTTAYADAAWVRVLDPGAVFSGRSTTASGRVVLDVVDPLVAAAAGTWELVGDGSGLVCQRSDAEPDLRVPVDLLAPLVWSFTTATRAAAAGRIDARAPATLGVLDALLAWPRPSWCTTGF